MVEKVNSCRGLKYKLPYFLGKGACPSKEDALLLIVYDRFIADHTGCAVGDIKRPFN